MDIAEKHMTNGQAMLDEFNLDMAAFYFEVAAKMFFELGEYEKSVKAYERVKYCYETDDKFDKAKEIAQIIDSLKK